MNIGALRRKKFLKMRKFSKFEAKNGYGILETILTIFAAEGGRENFKRVPHSKFFPFFGFRGVAKSSF